MIGQEIRKKEDESIRMIKNEINEQRTRLFNQRKDQFNLEQKYIKRRREDQELEEKFKRREEICGKFGYKNTKVGKKCDISLNGINLNKLVILFACNHQFHVDCILNGKRAMKAVHLQEN